MLAIGGRGFLSSGRQCGTAAAGAAAITGDGGHFKNGQQRFAAEGRLVGSGDFADGDFLHELEALGHDFHVGVDDGFAELAELLDVLLHDDVAVLLLRDAELLQHGADGEEGAEEGVALHAELKIGAVGGFAGDFEAGQSIDANLFLDDLLARP